MDIFTEAIVTRQKSGKDYFYIGGIVALALFVFYIGLMFYRQLGSFFLLYTLAVFYGAYYWISRFHIEFEYILTNGELDIDRITAKKARRRIITVNAKQFDLFVPIADSQVKNLPSMGIQRTIHVEGDRKSPEVYVAVLTHKGVKTCIYLQPSQRILEDIERFVPKRRSFQS